MLNMDAHRAILTRYEIRQKRRHGLYCSGHPANDLHPIPAGPTPLQERRSVLRLDSPSHRAATLFDALLHSTGDTCER